MTHRLATLVLAALAVGCSQAAETAVTDSRGALSGLSVGGEFLDLSASFRIPLQGWGNIPSLADARDVKVTREGDATTWTGSIPVGNTAYRYTQTLTERDGVVTLDFSAKADGEVATEGVYFWLDIPRSVFIGGEAVLQREDLDVGREPLPVDKPAQRHFLRGEADRVDLTSADGRVALGLGFDRALPVVVQDTRDWNGTTYSAFAMLTPGLKAGETTSVQVQLMPRVQPDHTPVNLTLRPDEVRYRLHGFGGNYCFGIESPVTQYTLANLRQAWARTELTGYEWEPVNDNDDPNVTDWDKLAANDTPGSNLRREFELAKQIQDKGIPYAIAVWGLPSWVYVEPAADGRRQGKRKIDPAKWDEVLEHLGSYLVYAKRQYGVEPDLFSFNEADIGVDVWLTAEEHRDAIKRIGAHFEQLGLKTKMLLADTGNARDKHTYALPTAEDPEAMRYVGALGFHSWGGATPEQYNAWADLAERLGLPLLVSELGVDAGAWRGRTYTTFQYAVREMQHYQELLLHARPQGTMQWEFTSDYSLLREENGELQPTPRYQFVRHFCNLTPLNADALGVASDHDKVFFTAFAGEEDGERVHTLHIANTGASRPMTLTGLPAGIERLHAVRSGEQEAFAVLEPLTVTNGTVTTQLPMQSLLTLTTRPPGE